MLEILNVPTAEKPDTRTRLSNSETLPEDEPSRAPDQSFAVAYEEGQLTKSFFLDDNEMHPASDTSDNEEAVSDGLIKAANAELPDLAATEKGADLDSEIKEKQAGSDLDLGSAASENVETPGFEIRPEMSAKAADSPKLIDGPIAPPQDKVVSVPSPTTERPSRESLAANNSKPSTKRPSTAETIFSSAMLTNSEPAVETTKIQNKTAPAFSLSTNAVTVKDNSSVKPINVASDKPSEKENKNGRLAILSEDPPKVVFAPAGAKAANTAFSRAQTDASLVQHPGTVNTIEKEKTFASVFTIGETDAIGTGESKANTLTSQPAVQRPVGHAEIAMMIGRQMTEALQRLPDRPVEISLNPSELGRVRMSISAAEAGISVSVLVERPETLELMRRNIDELANEFLSIGYENINFSFAEGNSGQTSDDDQHEPVKATLLTLETDAAEIDVAASSILVDGLDLRL